MKKINFSVLGEELQKLTLRFPFVVFSLLGLSALMFAEINDWVKNIEVRVWIFFAYALFLSFSVALATEKKFTGIVKNAISLGVLGLLAWYAFTLPVEFTEFQNLQHVLLGLILFLSMFVVAYFGKNNNENFWEFGRKNLIRMFLTYVFSGILMGGLSLAVLSLKELFKLDITDEVFQNLAVFSLLIFSVVYFLIHVPAEDEKYHLEIDFSKPLKFLTMYILLPVLGLYMLILYVYLLQIVVSWELPNGWVTTLISVLGLIGLMTMMMLYPMIKEGENKLIRFLSKYFPALMLPLLILMSVAIFRRIDDYGLTVNRLFAVVLNVWLYGVSIYLFLTSSRTPKWILISLLAVALISVWGPVSVFKITKNTLLNELSANMDKAGLLKENQFIVPDATYQSKDSVDYKRIVDVFDYLKKNYGNEIFDPYFSKGEIDQLSKGIFSLNKFMKTENPQNPENLEEGFFRAENQLNTFDIDGHSILMNVEWNKHNTKKDQATADSLSVQLMNNNLSVKIKDRTVQVPVNEYVETIMAKGINKGKSADCVFEGENFKFIIEEMNYNFYPENKKLKEVSFLKGMLILRE